MEDVPWPRRLFCSLFFACQLRVSGLRYVFFKTGGIGLIDTISIGLEALVQRVIGVENEPDLKMRYQALPRRGGKVAVTLVEGL